MNKSWFFGKLGRVETESLLLSAAASCYLVRESSVPGSYALSVFTKEKNAFTHFLIASDKNGFSLKDSLDLNSYKTLDLLLSNSCETVGHVPLGTALQKPVTLNADWFCGTMSRQEAEQILYAATSSCYLLRESSPGNYSISYYVQKNKTIHHNSLEKLDKGFRIMDSSDLVVYSSLEELLKKSPEFSQFIPYKKSVKPAMPSAVKSPSTGTSSSPTVVTKQPANQDIRKQFMSTPVPSNPISPSLTSAANDFSIPPPPLARDESPNSSKIVPNLTGKATTTPPKQTVISSSPVSNSPFKTGNVSTTTSQPPPVARDVTPPAPVPREDIKPVSVTPKFPQPTSSPPLSKVTQPPPIARDVAPPVLPRDDKKTTTPTIATPSPTFGLKTSVKAVNPAPLPRDDLPPPPPRDVAPPPIARDFANPKIAVVSPTPVRRDVNPDPTISSSTKSSGSAFGVGLKTSKVSSAPAPLKDAPPAIARDDPSFAPPPLARDHAPPVLPPPVLPRDTIIEEDTSIPPPPLDYFDPGNFPDDGLDIPPPPDFDSVINDFQMPNFEYAPPVPTRPGTHNAFVDVTKPPTPPPEEVLSTFEIPPPKKPSAESITPPAAIPPPIRRPHGATFTPGTTISGPPTPTVPLNNTNTAAPAPYIPPRPTSVVLPKPRPGSTTISSQPNLTSSSYNNPMPSITPSSSTGSFGITTVSTSSSTDSLRSEKKDSKKDKKEKKEKEKKEKKDKKGKKMTIEGPTNVQHLMHVGFGANGFELKNIPPEWKNIMKGAGIKKSDMQNPETAAFVFSTIGTALQSSVQTPPPPPLLVPKSNSSAMLNTNILPPPPPPLMPPREGENGSNGPALPARTGSALNLRTSQIAEPIPPPPPPPPEPEPETVVSTSSANLPSNPLLAQLVNAQLKSVQKGVLPPVEESQTPNLVNVLSKAMTSRRLQLHVDEDEEFTNDDWD